MGNTGDAARVDGAVLRAAAHEYDAAAAILDAVVRSHLGERPFGAPTAGRGYVADGARLRAALDDVTDALRQWSRACAEVAAGLRDSADRYAAADSRAAEQVSR